jgi:general stress protein 26
MKTHPQASPEMQRLAERLQGQRVAMLTLRDSRGRLGARPLTPLEMDAQGAVWMLVSKKAVAPLFAYRPEDAARLDALDTQPANLSFSDEPSSLFVSISGRARLVDDMARKVLLWTALARPWFSGVDDPDLTLLCVQPEEAEVWDGPDSSVVRVLALAASVVAGAPIGLGEHEHVIPPTPAAHLNPTVPNPQPA